LLQILRSTFPMDFGNVTWCSSASDSSSSSEEDEESMDIFSPRNNLKKMNQSLPQNNSNIITRSLLLYDESELYRRKKMIERAMDTSEFKLVLGYLPRNAPLDVMQLIYIFFHLQYRVMRGNALCIVKPNERLFTTEKFAWETCSYMKLTKPLCSGIAEFEMECVAGKRCCSIGVITNLEAEVGHRVGTWLFDDKRCGDSYQLYMTAYKSENALYHFSDGQQMYEELIGDDKPSSFSPGERAKFVLDFDKNEITFFVDGVKIGKPMQVKEETTYYAAFVWTTFNNTGATFKLCSTPTFA